MPSTSPYPTHDPVTGRLTESRLGYRADDLQRGLAQWGSMPLAPVCGPTWLEQFPTTPATLSNGLATDRQWYAFQFTACLIKGFCEYDVIANVLANQGVYPVQAFGESHSRPLAMATLWFNLIHDSVCGCYHEVILSFDVNYTQSHAVAFQASERKAPWALQYPSFGSPICDAQFLHSLWINSPLSITWGREMQAFPKHPRPVASKITDHPSRFSFDICWDDQVVLRGHTHKQFGAQQLLQESWGLLTTQPPLQVLRFLTTPSFDIPILMPVQTAQQNQVPRHYLGHLWKGLNPMAVQVWPWSAEDQLELGSIHLETGCEDHNGHELLRAANFQPAAVTYLPRAAAFIQAWDTGRGAGIC